MDAIVLLGLLTSLAVAAVRWGHDSRDTIRSKEEGLATYGVSWLDLEEDATDVCDASHRLALAADYAAGHHNGVHTP